MSVRWPFAHPNDSLIATLASHPKIMGSASAWTKEREMCQKTVPSVVHVCVCFRMCQTSIVPDSMSLRAHLCVCVLVRPCVRMSGLANERNTHACSTWHFPYMDGTRVKVLDGAPLSLKQPQAAPDEP